MKKEVHYRINKNKTFAKFISLVDRLGEHYPKYNIKVIYSLIGDSQNFEQSYFVVFNNNYDVLVEVCAAYSIERLYLESVAKITELIKDTDKFTRVIHNNNLRDLEDGRKRHIGL